MNKVRGEQSGRQLIRSQMAIVGDILNLRRCMSKAIVKDPAIRTLAAAAIARGD